VLKLPRHPGRILLAHQRKTAMTGVAAVVRLSAFCRFAYPTSVFFCCRLLSQTNVEQFDGYRFCQPACS
jgi:hypothetical protein